MKTITGVAKSASKAASSTAKAVSRQSSKGYTSIKTAVVKTNPKKLNTQGIVLIVLGVLVLVGLGVGIYYLARECDMYCAAVKSIRSDFNTIAYSINIDEKRRLFENLLKKLIDYPNIEQEFNTIIKEVFKPYTNKWDMTIYGTRKGDILYQVNSLLKQKNDGCSSSDINLEDSIPQQNTIFSNRLSQLFKEDKFFKLILASFLIRFTYYNESISTNDNKIIITDKLNPTFKKTKNNKKPKKINITDLNYTGDNFPDLINGVLENIHDDDIEVSFKTLLELIVEKTKKDGIYGISLLSGSKCVRTL